MSIRFDILTLFPDMFPPVLETSIPGRAETGGHASYHVHDIRHWTDDAHGSVDDRPYGGGPGMVMMCQPVFDTVQAVEAMDEQPARRILLTPQGTPLDQARVRDLAQSPRLLLIAGHYEGFDQRIIEELEPEEISIGDYVLSGGEIPVLVLIDAVTRLVPGVLGHEDSAAEDSFSRFLHIPDTTDPSSSSSSAAAGLLLDCPHYTRPRTWRNRPVPEVLLSGNHEAIREWRQEQMIERTIDRRPDLMPAAMSAGEDQGMCT